MEVPIFVPQKKDDGIRFVFDFRKLNEALERDSFPLPVIDDVSWKLQGFTFATYIELNLRCYHFAINKKSKKLTWTNTTMG